MAEKKHIPGKAEKQSIDPVAFQGTSTENVGRSFWKQLLENTPRLFLYQKICIFLIAFLVFANGIPNGFNVDDTYYTTKDNPIAGKGLKAISTIFTTHTLYDNNKNSFEYRPVAMLSFALQHQFLGYAPATSHFISVLIYSFLCLLIFVLLCHWFGSSKSWFAFFVVLVYAVHPLHTEVVDNIKNRDELLATFFGVLSMIYAWKWYKTGKIWHICLCIFVFILGMLCKRTMVTCIAIIPMAFYFFSDIPIRKILIPSVVLVITVFMLAGVQNFFLLPEEQRVYLYFENPMYVTHQPLGIQTATASYILGWYSYLHVIPYPLSFYYGYKYVKLLDWGSVLPILSLVVYLLLVYLVIRNIRKKAIVAFGALYFLVCILPYSNLLTPAPGMMAERFAFASSLGYCILLVSVLSYLYKISPVNLVINKNSKYLVATFLFILAGYTAMSVVRNAAWENSWTLYNHDIKHLQNSAKANMLYGEQILSRNNQWRQAFDRTTYPQKQLYRDSLLQYLSEEKESFLRVLAIAPGYSKALNNLAVAYINDDSLEEAKKYLFQALSLSAAHADNSTTHYNLGTVYINLRARNNNASFVDSSIDQFKAAIHDNPKYLAAYERLCQVYLNQRDTASAIDILRSGTQSVPDISLLYVELAEVYLYKRDTIEAIHYYERGVEIPHPEPTLIQLLVNYHHSKNNIEKETYYRNKMSKMNAEANHGD